MEGEFESFKKVVSNGCETKMKKFNFNFKFLDRFKKKNPEETEINPDDLPIDPEDTEDDDYSEFQEMPRKDKTGLHTKPNLEEEFFSDDNPEVFAEKTLSNYSLEQFNLQNELAPKSVDELGPDAPPPIDK